MKNRAFGAAGTQVSEVGLGTWQLGGDCWGDVPETDALAVLNAAADAGVTFIDTADVYGSGRSESLIGRFLRERGRDGFFVATKVGRFPEPGWPDNFSLKVFREHTEASLRRLGVDALDLSQLHSIPAEYYRRGDVFDWLRRLRDEGKIRRFGVSVESMDEALVCLEQDGLASLQIIFNIFRQKPIAALFDRAKARGVALIARLPLASGLLAGKYKKDTVFADTDHRRFNRDGQKFNVGETFAGLPYAYGLEVVDRVRPLIPAGMTMAQAALRWVLDHDAVTTVIPGARSADQVRANAAASGLPPLAPGLHGQLARLYHDQVEAHVRGPY